MKTKIIALIMMVFALTTLGAFADEIDPGTGVDTGILASKAAWSPDGKFLVTNGKSSDYELYLYSLENKTSEKIYTSVPYNQESRRYGAFYNCFTPDGKEIYFQTSFEDRSRGTSGDGLNPDNILPVIMAVHVESKAVRWSGKKHCPPVSARMAAITGTSITITGQSPILQMPSITMR